MNPLDGSKWQQPAPVSMPSQSEIHVWLIPLARSFAEVAMAEKNLSGAERERAARFHFHQDKRRFVIRRAVLRQILAACLETGSESISLDSVPNGKPLIRGQENPGGLRFNSSHSGDLALIGLARGFEVGIDVEQHRPLPDAEDLAKTFFSEVETAELAALPPPLKTAGFFDCWTRKEAFVKATGWGLSYPLNRFSVSLARDQPATLLSVIDEPEAVKKWTMVSLDLPPRYSAAVVFAGKKMPVKCFEWNLPLLG